MRSIRLLVVEWNESARVRGQESVSVDIEEDVLRLDISVKELLRLMQVIQVCDKQDDSSAELLLAVDLGEHVVLGS